MTCLLFWKALEWVWGRLAWASGAGVMDDGA